MNNFISRIIEEKPYKIIISNKQNKTEQFNKIVIALKNIRSTTMYQVEKYTETQVFHINVNITDLKNVIYEYIPKSYKQLNAFSINHEFCLKISKKNKILTSIKPNLNINKADLDKLTNHNKTKQYLLKEGTIIPPLIDLGIFTKDGHIVKSMYDKYKQINKFIEIVESSLKNYTSDTIRIIDFGCGKSYLTFILYYYLVEIKKLMYI